MPEQRLLQQIELAIRSPTARYIISAVVDTLAYDAGEIMVTSHAEIEVVRDAVLEIASRKLRDVALTRAQISHAIISIEEAPLLY